MSCGRCSTGFGAVPKALQERLRASGSSKQAVGRLIKIKRDFAAQQQQSDQQLIVTAPPASSLPAWVVPAAGITALVGVLAVVLFTSKKKKGR